MMALVAVPELPQKLHSVQGVMFIKQVLCLSVHVKLRESKRNLFKLVIVWFFDVFCKPLWPK